MLIEVEHAFLIALISDDVGEFKERTMFKSQILTLIYYLHLTPHGASRIELRKVAS